MLSDLNAELIDLYLGVKRDPHAVWKTYSDFPNTKEAYYVARSLDPQSLSLETRAARLLFLNRTCFKGMWRHNSAGEFNVGYGGQDRRWVMTAQDLCTVAERLSTTELRCADFEEIVDNALEGDLIFADPPYRRGQREQLHEHYIGGRFKFEDQARLSAALGRATNRGVRWAVTNSSHRELLELYTRLPSTVEVKPVGNGEVLISNRSEESRTG